jgi:hypothetical protein
VLLEAFTAGVTAIASCCASSPAAPLILAWQQAFGCWWGATSAIEECNTFLHLSLF